jgi:hypothetical protein
MSSAPPLNHRIASIHPILGMPRSRTCPPRTHPPHTTTPQTNPLNVHARTLLATHNPLQHFLSRTETLDRSAFRVLSQLPVPTVPYDLQVIHGACARTEELFLVSVSSARVAINTVRPSHRRNAGLDMRKQPKGANHFRSYRSRRQLAKMSLQRGPITEAEPKPRLRRLLNHFELGFN